MEIKDNVQQPASVPTNGVTRKIPPPPPTRKNRPSDLLAASEAARRVNRDLTWVLTRVKDGRLVNYGDGRSHGGHPTVLVSLKVVEALNAKSPRHLPRGLSKLAREHEKKKKAAKRTHEGEPTTRTHKGTGVTQFAREEIKHFAEAIMLGVLDARSITITHVGTEKDVLLFDVMVTPRAPAVKTFSIE